MHRNWPETAYRTVQQTTSEWRFVLFTNILHTYCFDMLGVS